MPRLRAKHLPHRISYRTPPEVALVGSIPAELRTGRPAYVEDKQKLVVDQRAGSDTRGQEINATTFVVVLPEDDMIPGAEVTVHAGTIRERTSQVVMSSKFDYNRRTPNDTELWLE